MNYFKFEELDNTVWETGEQLKGRIDGWEFKEYFLGLLFYKYLSDYLTEYINDNEREIGNFEFDYVKLNDNKAESIREKILKEKFFFLKPSELFENVRKNAISSENISETLETIFNSIENSANELENRERFIDIFENIDFNSTKLGKTLKERNKYLEILLNAIGDIEIENNQKTLSDIYGEIFEYLFEKYSVQSSKNGGEFYTPSDINELLIRISTDKKKTVNKIYDPACGTGSLLIETKKILGRESILDKFYGQDISSSMYNLCRMNMILHDIPFNIQCGDTLTNPKQLKEGPFEVIVSNPPFSARWEGEDNSNLVSDKRFSPAGVLAPKKSADMAFIMHALSQLSDDGIAAILVAPGILHRSGAEQEIRKYLVENNFIDSIIQLPPNTLFGTGIAPCIMVLRKDKSDENILFIDASKEFTKTKSKNTIKSEVINNIVSTNSDRLELKDFSILKNKSKVEQEEYNLNPSLYFFEDLNEKTDNWELLSNLTESISLGSYRKNRINKKKPILNAKLVELGNLNSNLIQDDQDLNIVETNKINALQKGDIIISRSFSELRVALFDIKDSEVPIIADANTFIIRVDKSKINPTFLLAFLSNALGKDQLLKYAIPGSVMKNISVKSLESLKIPTLSLKEQEEIGERFIELVKEKLTITERLNQKQEEINSFTIDLS